MPSEVVARAASTVVGRGESELSYLANGLSSDAWLVSDGEHRLVLRIGRTAGQLDEFAREHRVLDALVSAGAHVPTPVAGSWEYPDWPGPPFSVTTFLAGEPLAPQDALMLADEIADFVETLQAILAPAGMPGVADRFAAAPVWPIHRSNLVGHPVAGSPRLAAQVGQLADQIGPVLAGPPVLVHSDLHEGNIVRTETGAGFLDFGCAFVGSALWDFAALAFFLGWPLAERVLDSGRHGVDAVRLVAVSFALYRWETAGDDREEADHCAAFLRETLSLIQGGS